MFRYVFFALMLVGLPVGAAAQDRTYDLEVDGNVETILVWDAEGEPRGTVLFGHGWGADPTNYERLLDAWTALGFTIEAPRNLDSAKHPRNAALPTDFMAMNQAVVGQRMTTMMALRERAAEQGLPVVLSGHSFGAFVAMTQAEGKWAFGPLPGPKPAAVLTFSSPGAVPMLVSDASYATLDLPYMMVTGTQDASGTTMPTWEVHRFAFDRSPADDKYLLVVEDGGHNLVTFEDESLEAPVVEWTSRFLAAYALGDEEAEVALAAEPMAERISVKRISVERR